MRIYIQLQKQNLHLILLKISDILNFQVISHILKSPKAYFLNYQRAGGGAFQKRAVTCTSKVLYRESGAAWRAERSSVKV